jgi:hypothetical protein
MQPSLGWTNAILYMIRKNNIFIALGRSNVVVLHTPFKMQAEYEIVFAQAEGV